MKLFRRRRRNALVSLEHIVNAFFAMGLLGSALKAWENRKEQEIAVYHDELNFEVLNSSTLSFESVTLKAYGAGKLLKEHVLKRPDGLITPKTRLICGFGRNELNKLPLRDIHFFLSIRFPQSGMTRDFEELEIASLSYLKTCELRIIGQDIKHLSVEISD